MPEIGRNHPCPCGSGLKYKHCCQKKGKPVHSTGPASGPRLRLEDLKIAAGTVLVCLLCLASAFLTPRIASPEGPKDKKTESLSDFDKRVGQIRPALMGQKVIGYLNDSYTGVDSFDATASSDYYLIQYALSPVIISSHPDQPFILGYFHKPFDPGRCKVLLTTVRDFGGGLFLLKNEGPKT